MESRQSVTLGETLRRARLARGVTLAEAEVGVRVRLRYLQALESDDYSALPPAVYTRVLIREYARFLGLDPGMVLDMAMPMRPEDRNPIRPAVQPLEKPSFISWKVVSSVSVLAFCAGLFLYLYAQYNSFAQSVDRPAVTPTPAARGISSAVTAIPAFPTDTPVPTATPQPSPTAVSGLLIEARLAERSWVQVWADRLPVLAEILPAGTSRSFSAERVVRMRVGNAGAVDVTVNGVPHGRLGQTGQAVDANWDRG